MTKDYEMRGINNNANVLSSYKSPSSFSSKTHNRVCVDGREDYSFAARAKGLMTAAKEFDAAAQPFRNLRQGEPLTSVAFGRVSSWRGQFDGWAERWKGGAQIPAFPARYQCIFLKERVKKGKCIVHCDAENRLRVERTESNHFEAGEPRAKIKTIARVCEWYDSHIRCARESVETVRERGLFTHSFSCARDAVHRPGLIFSLLIVCERMFARLLGPISRQFAAGETMARISFFLAFLRMIEKRYSRRLSNWLAGCNTPKKASFAPNMPGLEQSY